MPKWSVQAVSQAEVCTLPARQLGEYVSDRQTSELARVLATTKKMMAEVDRVVILGSQLLQAGPRALFESCCQPYFNELSRGARGSRPRIYFAENHCDNDAIQGLLQLLGAHRTLAASNVSESWALVLLDESSEASENESNEVASATQAHLRVFSQALLTSCGHDQELFRSRCVCVAREASQVRQQATEFGCQMFFSLPAGLEPSFSVLSVAGLVPAALMGINVMKLLEGAASISEHFNLSSLVENNIVLQFATINHMLERHAGVKCRVLSVDGRSLKATADWYRWVVAACLGKSLEIDWPPLARSASQLYANKLVHCITSQATRFDALYVDCTQNDASPVEIGQKVFTRVNMSHVETYLQYHAKCVERTRSIFRDTGIRLTHTTIPCIDETCMGQYLQWMMLTVAMESQVR